MSDYYGVLEIAALFGATMALIVSVHGEGRM